MFSRAKVQQSDEAFFRRREKVPNLHQNFIIGATFLHGATMVYAYSTHTPDILFEYAYSESGCLVKRE